MMKDNNPIGTILTVPTGTTVDGYFDYKIGKTFNKVLYPELYKALGTNVLGSINTDSGLPVGTLIYSFNKHNVDGWVEVSSKTRLSQYPELHRVITQLVEKLPNSSESKSLWSNALNYDVLPDISCFLKAGTNGEYNTATVGTGLTTLPVVIDESNTLSPVGLSRCTTEGVISPVVGCTETDVKTDYVLLGSRADKFTGEYKYVSQDKSNVSEPESISARLLIKAVSTQANIPSTHKLIIKYEA